MALSYKTGRDIISYGVDVCYTGYGQSGLLVCWFAGLPCDEPSLFLR